MVYNNNFPIIYSLFSVEFKYSQAHHISNIYISNKSMNRQTTFTTHSSRYFRCEIKNLLNVYFCSQIWRCLLLSGIGMRGRGEIFDWYAADKIYVIAIVCLILIPFHYFTVLLCRTL